MRRILVLRPEPGATATVKRARSIGLDAFAVPLFEVEPVGWTAPDPASFDGLLLTSANAIRHAGEQLQSLRGLPVHAVGAATADAARAAGFDAASVGDQGVDRLLSSVDPNLRLLHLCGEHRKNPDASQEIQSIVVYRAHEREVDLSRAQGVVALIHSLRAGHRFAELVSDRQNIVVAAISEDAVKSIGEGWAQVATAERPDDDALLALAARLCNKPVGE